MPDDSFTEITSQSWLGRIGESIKGVLFGLVLVAGAGALLFWNEGRAVKRAQTLKEGVNAVISVAADHVNPANAGKLVHLAGLATTEDTVEDREFALSTNALKLKRIAEMYQWKESESETKDKNLGGGTTTKTTYYYTRAWDQNLIASARFKQPEGHENPASMPYSSRESVAAKITLGAFTLSASLAGKIDDYTVLPMGSVNHLPPPLQDKCKVADGRLYLGADPAAPQIGDQRIGFQIVRPTVVSLVARQVGNTFEPYISKNGGSLELLQVGELSAGALFQAAQHRNTLLTWGLRLGGVLLMWFGFVLLTKPFVVLADVVPFIGSLVEFGTSLVSLLAAAGLSLVIIAVAWFWYRPLLALVLIAVAVAIPILLRQRLKWAPLRA